MRIIGNPVRKEDPHKIEKLKSARFVGMHSWETWKMVIVICVNRI